MKIVVPPLHYDADFGFGKRSDVFGRQQFGESLANLVQNTDDNVVLALEAPWGEGKTTFIHMWRQLLDTKSVRSIYFDAFENDYNADVMLCLASRIYGELAGSDGAAAKKFMRSSVSMLKLVARAGTRVAIKTATLGALDETILEDLGAARDASSEAAGIVDAFLQDRLASAEKDKRCIEEFRKSLESLVEKAGGKLVFIIDELDRCKPSHALSILETIKHLYSVSGLVFVLAVNRTQLTESVKHEYGTNEEDASRYLQKFITFWCQLPKRRLPSDSDAGRYVKSCLNAMGFERSSPATEQDFISFAKSLVTHYDLSPREVERSLTNFAVILNIGGMELRDELLEIGLFVSIIHTKNHELFKKLARNDVPIEKLLQVSEIVGFRAEGRPHGSEDEFLILLKFCMSDDERARRLVDSHHRLTGLARTDRNYVQKVCSFLHTLSRTRP